MLSLMKKGVDNAFPSISSVPGLNAPGLSESVIEYSGLESSSTFEASSTQFPAKRSWLCDTTDGGYRYHTTGSQCWAW